jgi:hypothetical protein
MRRIVGRELFIGPPDFGRGRRGGPGAWGGERAEKNSESHKITNQTKQPVSKKKNASLLGQAMIRKKRAKKNAANFPIRPLYLPKDRDHQ